MVVTFVFYITMSPSQSLCCTSLNKWTERLKWDLRVIAGISKDNLDVKGQLFVGARCRGGVYFLYTDDEQERILSMTHL